MKKNIKSLFIGLIIIIFTALLFYFITIPLKNTVDKTSADFNRGSDLIIERLEQLKKMK